MPSQALPRRRRYRTSPATVWLWVAVSGMILTAAAGGNPLKFLALAGLIGLVMGAGNAAWRLIKAAFCGIDSLLTPSRGRRPSRARPVHFLGGQGQQPIAGPWWRAGVQRVDAAKLAANAIGTQDPLLREPIEAGMDVTVCVANHGRCGAVFPSEVRQDLAEHFQDRCPTCGSEGEFESVRIPAEAAASAPTHSAAEIPIAHPAPSRWATSGAWKDPVEGRPRLHPPATRRLVFREISA